MCLLCPVSSPALPVILYFDESGLPAIKQKADGVVCGGWAAALSALHGRAGGSYPGSISKSDWEKQLGEPGPQSRRHVFLSLRPISL